MKRLPLLAALVALSAAGCGGDATERGTDYTSQLRERAARAQATTPAQMAGRMSVTQSVPLSPETFKDFGRMSARVHRAIDGASWQEGHARVQAIFASLPDDGVTTIWKASAAMDVLSRRFAAIDSPEQAEAAAYYVDVVARVPGVQAAVANRALLAAAPHLPPAQFQSVAARLVAASDALDRENQASATTATQSRAPRPLTDEEQLDEALRVQTLDALRARLAS